MADKDGRRDRNVICEKYNVRGLDEQRTWGGAGKDAWLRPIRLRIVAVEGAAQDELNQRAVRWPVVVG